MEMTRRTLLTSALASGAIVGTASLTACSSSGTATISTAGTTSGAPTGATSGLSTSETAPLQLFASPTFNDEALFALGGASSLVAEPGEILRIAQNINAKSGNPADPTTATFDDFYDGFGSFGDNLDQLAQQAGSAHAVTMASRLMRAAMCSTQQLFFVLGTGNGAREESIYDVTQRRWLTAMKVLYPKMVQFSVKSEFGPLPGYFIPAPGGGRRPTVLVSSGSDGQNVESMQFGVTAGLQRGYNIVLYEGPGQMSLLFKRNIPFTAQWNKVVGPVLSWVKARPDVGKVALIGVSFGGMLCASAAAKLKGLDAVVLEPGGWNFPMSWPDQEDMKFVQETAKAPPQEQAAVATKVNAGFLEQWGSMPRTSQFEIYKRGEIFSPEVQQEARAGKPISNYYAMLAAMLPFNFEADYRAITIPTMITINEGDTFFGNQPVEAFAMLDKVPAGRKVLQKFTGAQGAALHDQPSGPQVAQEFIFDWLDDQLR
ncbi:MAG: alpha/beta hydrolase [Actinomycetes bacterium]